MDTATRVQIFDETLCISLKDMKTLSCVGHPWERYKSSGGARGVMVIVAGNGHVKSWTRLIAFHIALIPLGKV